MADAPHRIKVRVLVLLASFLAFLAIFTGWVDRQVLDTDEWVDTSGRLLEDEEAVLMLILITLAAIGVEALSRRSRHEFPRAKRGDWLLGMRQRAQRAGAEAGRRIGSAIRELADDDRHPEDAKLDRLERLGQLKEKGVLTAGEFRVEKKRILEDAALEEEVTTAPAKRRRG